MIGQLKRDGATGDFTPIALVYEESKQGKGEHKGSLESKLDSTVAKLFAQVSSSPLGSLKQL